MNKAIPLLILGAVISGSAAIYLTHNYINNRVENAENIFLQNNKSIKIVVASIDIKEGDVLSYDNLSLRDMPIKYVHTSAVRAEQADAVVGKDIKQNLRKGEALLNSFILSENTEDFVSLIEDGQRAITFRVDRVSSMSGLLRPGNKIDLMHTLSSGNKITRPLLTNVMVLATGDSIDKVNYNEKGLFQTLTIAVTPINASRITLARNTGTINVVLRSAQGDVKDGNDDGVVAPVSMNNLYGNKRKPGKSINKIEIIVGG